MLYVFSPNLSHIRDVTRRCKMFSIASCGLSLDNHICKQTGRLHNACADCETLKIDAGDGTSSGMMWTCDEWPPASFVNLSILRAPRLTTHRVVEGGRDLLNPRDGTICAPWATSGCDQEMNDLVRGVPKRSEQNFQASAHSMLRVSHQIPSTTKHGEMDLDWN